MRQTWITVSAVVVFVIGGALSLYRLLHRTDQELEMRVFEVTVTLDQYTMPFSDPQEARCPPALATGESGTVHLRTTNQSTTPYTLSLDYGTCHINAQPGETVQADCMVQTNTTADDYVIVHLLPVEDTSSIYSPRKAVCSIPIVNVGSLTGQQALILTVLPGLLVMLAGAGLWIAAGQIANRELRVLTITGALLLIVILVAMPAVTLLTNVILRGDLLIGLTVGAVLLSAVLVVQLLVFGIMYSGRLTDTIDN
jgi:hypothetical protein